MPQSFEKILLHIVFSTENRTPFLASKPHREQLHAYVGGIIKMLQSIPISVGGIEDHIHILCTLSRTITIADMVKNIKNGATTKMKSSIRDFRWQEGYAVFSVSYSNRQQVIDYINDQETHHRRLTFQEEFLTLLRKHEIEFDEQYIWS